MEKSIIEFPVLVDNEIQKAAVIGEHSTPVDIAFRVHFEDGYEDLFSFDEDSGELYGILGSQSDKYASALEDDLGFLNFLDTSKFYHIFQHELNGQMTNIWVKEKNDESGKLSYGVYYRKHYHFELAFEKGEWIIYSISEDPGNIIDESVAKKVEYLLKAMI